MKKILAMLVTALLAVSTIATPVFAEGNLEKLEVGVPKVVDVARGEYVMFEFTPGKAGTYSFSSDVDEDVYDASILISSDEEGQHVKAEADDGGNFYLEYTLSEENKTVYVGICIYNRETDEAIGQVPLSIGIVELAPVDDPDDPYEDCQHIGTMVYYDETDSTCVSRGRKGWWQCEVCGKKFWDSACHEPVEDEDDLYKPMGEHKVFTQKKDIIEATCTKAGSYTEVQRCSVCLEKFSSKKVEVPATGHKWSAWKTTKTATLKDAGSKTRTCSACGKKETASIAKLKNVAKATVSGLKASYVYNAKYQTPAITVKYGSTTLKAGTDYTVTYAKNKNVGTATVTIKGTGKYGGTLTKTFKIKKHANTLKVTAKTATIKYSKVKSKKQTLTIDKVATIKKAKGTVTYKKVSGSSKVTINSKTGNVTVAKGTKKGTYKIKLKVSAKGTSNYKAGSKTVTFKIVVK